VLTLDYASNIDFGRVKYKNGLMILKALNQAPFVQISNWRAGDSGWLLTAAMTQPFTNQVSGLMLNGAVMRWQAGSFSKMRGNGSNAPTVSDFTLDQNGTAAKVMSALNNRQIGHGTWLDVF
jgi:hypothetical protein